MFEPPYFARALLVGGAALLILGLILGHALPMATGLPPYLVTALLALAFGGYEWWRGRTPKRRDRE
jgi:hypothetical protein